MKRRKRACFPKLIPSQILFLFLQTLAVNDNEFFQILTKQWKTEWNDKLQYTSSTVFFLLLFSVNACGCSVRAWGSMRGMCK